MFCCFNLLGRSKAKENASKYEINFFDDDFLTGRNIEQ
jgi:hypothetical protein